MGCLHLKKKKKHCGNVLDTKKKAGLGVFFSVFSPLTITTVMIMVVIIIFISTIIHHHLCCKSLRFAIQELIGSMSLKLGRRF